MSVRIKVSYTDDEELARVIRLLSPLVKSWKVAKKQEGAHKNAYISLRTEQTKDGERVQNPGKQRAGKGTL